MDQGMIQKPKCFIGADIYSSCIQCIARFHILLFTEKAGVCLFFCIKGNIICGVLPYSFVIYSEQKAFLTCKAQLCTTSQWKYMLTYL